MSVLVSVRPLNRESKMARAASAFDSLEIPKMSGRSLLENAVSGAFGLISSASDTAGGDTPNFEPRCQRCQAISQASGAVVNALIHLALPCHRHIDRLRRGDAGIGRAMLPPKARFLGHGIPLSV